MVLPRPASPETSSTSRPSPAGDALGGVGHRLHLGFASDHTHGRAHGQTTGQRDGRPGVGPSEGLPQHLDGLDRVGQSLQGQFPERAALVTIAPTGHRPHHVGGQDLPALAGGTQPGRLDDRVPEVVVVLSGDLPAAQAHPQTHRVLPVAVVPFDALLHGHGAARAAEAEPKTTMSPSPRFFTSVPPGLGDGLAQDREVLPADLVGGLGDRGCDNSVDPTTSVNRIVALSVVKNHLPGTPRRRRPEWPAQEGQGGHWGLRHTSNLGAPRRSTTRMEMCATCRPYISIWPGAQVPVSDRVLPSAWTSRRHPVIECGLNRSTQQPRRMPLMVTDRRVFVEGDR